MNSRRRRFVQCGLATSLSITLFGVLGCGTANGGPTTEKTGAPSWKVLATVTTADQQTVKFVQLAPGDVLIEQVYPIGMSPLVGGEDKKKPLADVYRLIKPNDPVPKELVDADALVAAARARSVQSPVDVPAPPTEARAVKSGPKFYTAGEQQWFQQHYCTEFGNVFCDQEGPGGSAIQGPWKDDSHINVAGMVGSEYAQSCGSTCPVSVVLTEWVCNGSCGEQQVYFTTIYAGQNWEWTRATGTFNWYRGLIGGEFGSGGPFSLAEAVFETL